MKKYIVAIYDITEGENVTYAIEADDEVKAAKKAIIEHGNISTPKLDFSEWINSAGDDLEQVRLEAVQGGLFVSTPYCYFS